MSFLATRVEVSGQPVYTNTLVMPVVESQVPALADVRAVQTISSVQYLKMKLGQLASLRYMSDSCQTGSVPKLLSIIITPSVLISYKLASEQSIVTVKVNCCEAAVLPSASAQISLTSPVDPSQSVMSTVRVPAATSPEAIEMGA